MHYRKNVFIDPPSLFYCLDVLQVAVCSNVCTAHFPQSIDVVSLSSPVFPFVFFLVRCRIVQLRAATITIHHHVDWPRDRRKHPWNRWHHRSSRSSSLRSLEDWPVFECCRWCKWTNSRLSMCKRSYRDRPMNSHGRWFAYTFDTKTWSWMKTRVWHTKKRRSSSSPGERTIRTRQTIQRMLLPFRSCATLRYSSHKVHPLEHTKWHSRDTRLPRCDWDTQVS